MKRQKSVTAAFEAKVREWVELYAPILGLSHTFIEIDFHHEDACSDPEDRKSWAHVSINAPYRNMTVSVHAKLAQQIEAFQERAIIHELSHAVTEPLKNLLWRITCREGYVTWRECKDASEAVTDHVAQIVWEMVGGEGP